MCLKLQGDAHLYACPPPLLSPSCQTHWSPPGVGVREQRLQRWLARWPCQQAEPLRALHDKDREGTCVWGKSWQLGHTQAAEQMGEGQSAVASVLRDLTEPAIWAPKCEAMFKPWQWGNK